MADNFYRFTEIPGSGRGLKARPYNQGGSLATSANIASIAWAAHIKGESSPFASGSLVVADVMSPVAMTSEDDPNFSYTFLWQSPGTNWPAAARTYRIIVTFTPTSGVPYKHVWEVATKSATGA